MNTVTEDVEPLFFAIAYSARHIFQLLNCINFVSKAHVRITRDGLQFTVEDSQVMQGQSQPSWKANPKSC